MSGGIYRMGVIESEIETGNSNVSYILNHPSIVKPRCHWNKVSNGHAEKTKFMSEEDAKSYISQHKLKSYQVYKCKVCLCYHIGHINKHIKQIKL